MEHSKRNPLMRRWLLSGLLLLVLGILPVTATAHEVYVLNSATIARDVSVVSPNPFGEIFSNLGLFAVSALLGVILVVVVFLISISRKIERALDPLLIKLKKWGPLVTRFTLGFCLIACSYYNALFGPELPLANIFGDAASVVRAILLILGIFILIGFWARSSAIVAAILFLWAVVVMRVYMLTYINYLGEILSLLILGSSIWSFNRSSLIKPSVILTKLEPYCFAINRVCFGIAILYASWYAKLIHSQLALDTVLQYHLTEYFHFHPLFIVLGALIIESLIGFFFIVGFEIRFTALLFLGFLTASLLYFGEVVWPHLILIGLNIAMIVHGYDRYSIEGRFFKKENIEPVL